MQSNFLRRILVLPKGVPSAQSKSNISEAFDSYFFFFARNRNPLRLAIVKGVYCKVRGVIFVMLL